MISKTPLSLELRKLNRLYNHSLGVADPDFSKYYSRLAVLELCGWVEEAMDEIAWQYPLRAHLPLGPDFDFTRSMIEKNYGFEYRGNFRDMMKPLLGIVVLSRIERRMNPVIKQSLEAALSNLKPERNEHAHRPLHKATMFTAPSVCLSLLPDIHKGLAEFES
jgi:hypothetical protein